MEEVVHHRRAWCERDVAKRRVKLLPAGAEARTQPPLPVRALVLPKWGRRRSSALQRVDAVEALATLIADRVWLGWPMTEAGVRRFLDWLAPLPAFRLAYSEAAQAVALLEEAMAALDSFVPA